jgi:hypothetical protein
VSHERAGVRRIARTLPERRLECRQRTQNVEPGLEYDDRNGQQVSQSEPRIAYPRPAEQGAAQYQYQAQNNKHDKKRVHQQYEVGGELKVGL